MTHWITDQLGTIGIFHSFTEEGVVIYDVRDILDEEKDIEIIKRKITIICCLLTAGERVAVRCAGGLNRSNCIAIGVLCYMNPWGTNLDEVWDHNYKKVKEAIPHALISQTLIDTTKKALISLYPRWGETCQRK